MGALNTKIIYRFLGVTAMLNGLFMFLTVPFSIYHNEPEKWGILNAGIITVFIGGSHDLIFPLYEVFQNFKQLVNIVSVDRSFDFSQEDELISGRSYMSKIIMEKPNVLNNYTNIGFQSYYCAEEEKDLMGKLYFDTLRLGQVLNEPALAEPIFRDADIIGFDMKCLSWQAIADPLKGQPNGIDSRTICSLTRYAGIIDHISSVGLFEIPSTPMTAQLFSHMIRS